MEQAQRLAFAKRVRELRKPPRPQSAIARAIDVDNRTYQLWEEAKNTPGWPNLEKLARFHGVSENWLLYGDEKPEAPQSQLDDIQRKVEALGDLLVELERAVAGRTRRKRGTGNGAADSASDG